jgi:hypothetical protein
MLDKITIALFMRCLIFNGKVLSCRDIGMVIVDHRAPCWKRELMYKKDIRVNIIEYDGRAERHTE